jgi:ABC-type transport system involved in multi-copper enzyme maturation permease subunit
MTALAPALPSPRLIGSDVLKLRKRRGLAVVVSLLTVAAVTLTFLIIQIFHWSSPATHGSAGGVTNLGHGTDLLMLLGAAAAAIVGSAAGAQDVDAGVYRDLVVTGRSRRSLFLSRLVGGLLYLLPFVIVGYAVVAVATVVWAGEKPLPSVHLLAVTGLWALANVTFYYLLAFGIACITGSRSYTIGILLAFRLALSPLIASIGALGFVRELMPVVAFANLAPATFVKQFSPPGDFVSMSTGAAVVVLLVWAAVALRIGSWRDTHRDA